MTVRVVPQPLGGPAIMRDYLAGKPQATRFFAHSSPFDVAAFARQAALLAERFTAVDRQRIAESLRPVDEAGRSRLARFVDKGGAVVTTGQQVGLFTGPLYTIHKALTAVRLAAELEAALGIVVLPVFWAASDDHDWDEIDHAFLLDAHYSPRRITVPGDRTIPLSAADRSLDSDVETAVAEATEVISAFSDSKVHVELLEGAYSAGAGVAAAFREILGGVLRGTGLLLTDAADAGIKASAAARVRHEIMALERHEAALIERGRALEAAGYHQQVSVLTDASNLFLRDVGGRERLVWRRGRWITRESGTAYTEGQLLELARAAPHRFSPNALLRPVFESAYFPVLAYVGGAAELSYFAQSQPLFESHGVPMPVVFPRFSAVLVPEFVARWIDELGYELSDLARPLHELEQDVARRGLPASARAALDELKRALVAAYEPVIEEAAHVDPTLRLAMARRRDAALLAAGEAEKKVVSGARRAGGAEIERLRAVKNVLFPFETPQERVLNVLPFLGMEPDLVSSILESIPRLLRV
jgi:bacillithiol synthase